MNKIDQRARLPLPGGRGRLPIRGAAGGHCDWLRPNPRVRLETARSTAASLWDLLSAVSKAVLVARSPLMWLVSRTRSPPEQDSPWS